VRKPQCSDRVELSLNLLPSAVLRPHPNQQHRPLSLELNVRRNLFLLNRQPRLIRPLLNRPRLRAL
jgi:hypothetical protein